MVRGIKNIPSQFKTFYLAAAGRDSNFLFRVPHSALRISMSLLTSAPAFSTVEWRTYHCSLARQPPLPIVELPVTITLLLPSTAIAMAWLLPFANPL
jgi:hypothetical protein